MVREIPSLRVLCLRAVGSHDCNAEKTFAPTKSGELSSASRLLQAFHRRPVDKQGEGDGVDCIPISRLQCVGPTTSRRAHANDVDMNHPFIAAVSPKGELVMERGNPALDCLQSYIDSLVELGRMDDTRLGPHFFEEWVRCCNAGNTKKRKRSSPTVPPSLGSLSLHNCSISDRTLQALSKATNHIAVLDLTGMATLTNDMVSKLLQGCDYLDRLSLKNCRRISSLDSIVKYCSKTLTCLDIGGSINLTVDKVLEAIPSLPALVELHASGLGWTDDTLALLVENENEWSGLSIGFSLRVTTAGLRNSLGLLSNSLTRVALHFCEGAVDNAFLGFLGKHLPLLAVLDIRGNGSVNSLTGWYDGRTAAGAPYEEELLVLARYTSITQSSLEDTKRIHPLHTTRLTCILDGGGTGIGIKR